MKKYTNKQKETMLNEFRVDCGFGHLDEAKELAENYDELYKDQPALK